MIVIEQCTTRHNYLVTFENRSSLQYLSECSAGMWKMNRNWHVSPRYPSFNQRMPKFTRVTTLPKFQSKNADTAIKVCGERQGGWRWGWGCVWGGVGVGLMGDYRAVASRILRMDPSKFYWGKKESVHTLNTIKSSGIFIQYVYNYRKL